MSRYIDADKIKWRRHERQALGFDFGLNEPGHYYTVNKTEVDDIPTADVEPVRHARWVKSDFGDGIFECSDCHKAGYAKKFEYCPDCGAKMDGENENHN